jgi:hypothetical protein
MSNELITWLPPFISAVGAITSVGGLAFTVYRGTQEWNKWKRERHVLKRAEVAGEVLVSSLRFLTGLQQIASPWITGEGPPDAEPEPTSERDRSKRDAEALGHILSNRWEQFSATSTAFVDAWERAEVYLPENVIALLEEVWKARASIHSNQHMHVMMGRQGHADRYDFFEAGFGTDIRKSLDDLRNRVKGILRPLAQMTGE